MENYLITTKETNKKFIKLSLTAAFIPLILGNIMGLLAISLMVKSGETSSISSFCLLFGIAGVIFGLYRAFSCISDGKTYLELYNDHIQGIGIINRSPNTFTISIAETLNITSNGTILNLHTSSGVYKIVTDVETASKTIELYQKIKTER